MAANTLSLPKRLLAIAILITFGFGLAGLSVEIIARLVYPVSDFLWQWDPKIGMTLVPGKHGRSVLRGFFDVPVDVNKGGFRDVDHAIEKPSGVKRVVLLGDSFVEAVQVHFEEA